jgi:hypothetical protein
MITNHLMVSYVVRSSCVAHGNRRCSWTSRRRPRRWPPCSIHMHMEVGCRTLLCCAQEVLGHQGAQWRRKEEKKHHVRNTFYVNSLIDIVLTVSTFFETYHLGEDEHPVIHQSEWPAELSINTWVKKVVDHCNYDLPKITTHGSRYDTNKYRK